MIVDNFGFLMAAYNIGEVRKTLKKAGKITLDWRANNSIIYDINKTEVIFFSKAQHQKLANQLVETKFRFGGEIVYFNKKAIRWLGI